VRAAVPVVSAAVTVTENDADFPIVPGFALPALAPASFLVEITYVYVPAVVALESLNVHFALVAVKIEVATMESPAVADTSE